MTLPVKCLTLLQREKLCRPANPCQEKPTLQQIQPLLWALLKFKYNRATNGCDKIYGLLGLQRDLEAIPVTLHYFRLVG